MVFNYSNYQAQAVTFMQFGWDEWTWPNFHDRLDAITVFLDPDTFCIKFTTQIKLPPLCFWYWRNVFNNIYTHVYIIIYIFVCRGILKRVLWYEGENPLKQRCVNTSLVRHSNIYLRSFLPTHWRMEKSLNHFFLLYAACRGFRLQLAVDWV